MSSSTSITAAFPTHTLSLHDSHVLTSILNPESLFSIATIDQSLPPLPQLSPAILPTLQARELSIIRPLDNTFHSPSDIQSAIASLTNLITEYPQYACAYNNRAQATRLLLGDDLRDEDLFKSTLWTDLGKAIELASSPSSSAAVSPLQAKVLASAHTHRGYLTWRLAKSADSSSSTFDPQYNTQRQGQEKPALPRQLQNKSKEKLEETASRDFELGGKYGNDAAREMATRTNPYAKLCGDIVKEAMRGEMGGAGRPV